MFVFIYRHITYRPCIYKCVFCVCGNASGSFLEELLMELALEVLALVKTVLVVNENKKLWRFHARKAFAEINSRVSFFSLGTVYVRKFNAFIDLLPRVITYCT